MSITFRRRENRLRLRLETLEPRALMATAGSLDPSFGAGYGTATAPTGVPVQAQYGLSASTVETLPDGNVLVVGTTSRYYSTNTYVNALTLVEFNANGTIDTSFGTNGLVQLPADLAPYQVAVESSGQIVLATNTTFTNTNGTTETGYFVTMLNANGSLDTSFGTNGFAQYPADTTTPAVDLITKIATVLIQSNSQIVLAGTSDAGFSAVRLNADGSLDTTYGTGGTVTVPVVPIGVPEGDVFADTVTGATIEFNDQVVLVGNVVTEEAVVGGIGTENAEIGVIRLNTDGSLDTTYGGSTAAGMVLIPADLSNPSAPGYISSTAVAVQPISGTIMVAGAKSNSSGSLSESLYRLNTNGTLDTTFGTAGEVTPSIPASTTIASMSVEPTGYILLSGYVSNGPPFPGVSLTREELLKLEPDGTPEATFGNTSTPGLLLTRLNYVTGIAVGFPTPAIQPTTGDIIMAGVGTVSAPSGLTYGFTVNSILPEATTGPFPLTPPPIPPVDFTGLGVSDLAVYDPTSGSFIYQSTVQTPPPPGYTSPVTFAFGIAGVGQTIPAVADYEGLGYSQFAAYLPTSGVYAILPTATSPGLFMQFGQPGAGQTIPAPADYEGDGKDDVAVYLTLYGGFAIIPSDGAPAEFVGFGQPGVGNSIPAPADYFGTGQADLAVYLTQVGAFAIRNPSTGTDSIIPFGKPGAGQSIPVPGDYDGSGHIELAVYVPSAGAYFYRPYGGGPDVEVPIGLPNAGYIPVPGDYDGSGRTEVAIYDPTTGVILYQPANGGAAVATFIGTANNGSLPVAAPAGALPEFTAPDPGSKDNAARSDVVPSVTSGSGTTAAITLSSARAVPSGPTLASLRVALSLVNQGDESGLRTEDSGLRNQDSGLNTSGFES